MKKTYISPAFLTVNLQAKGRFLEGSMIISGETAGRGGWVKEENTSVSDVNVWDEEW